MSAKQSKIYSFFQRKPSLSGNSSPSVTRTDSFNEDEKGGAVASPNASGDNSHASKPACISSTPNIGSANMKRKLVDFEKEKEKLHTNSSYKDEQLGGKKQKQANSVDADEQPESRPPKLKRKRIVSLIYQLGKPG